MIRQFSTVRQNGPKESPMRERHSRRPADRVIIKIKEKPRKLWGVGGREIPIGQSSEYDPVERGGVERFLEKCHRMKRQPRSIVSTVMATK